MTKDPLTIIYNKIIHHTQLTVHVIITVHVIYSIDAQRQSLGKLAFYMSVGSADGESPSLLPMRYFYHTLKSWSNDLQGILGAFFLYGKRHFVQIYNNAYTISHHATIKLRKRLVYLVDRSPRFSNNAKNSALEAVKGIPHQHLQ